MPASDPARPDRSRLGPRTRLAAKLLLLALAVEGAARVVSSFETPWYAAATRDPRLPELGLVFIGSSRAAAAIDAREMERAWEALGGGRRLALNLGRGHSTLVESYFGLRALAAARPDALTGVTVALEAPLGTPPRETWHDGWAHPDLPALLGSVIAPSDLPRFWRESSATVRAKWTVTAATFSHLPRIAGVGKGVLDRILALRLPRRSTAADLGRAGGVLAEDADVVRARRLAIEMARARGASEYRPGIDADDLVLRSVAELVRNSGGRLVLYAMPLSSVQRGEHLTGAGRREQAELAALAAAWQVPLLEPAMATNDEDFPDLWHLRQSRAREFTRHVAAAIAAWSPPAARP